MAFVAVAVRLVRAGLLRGFDPDDFFISDLRQALKPELVAATLKQLPLEQMDEFKEDVTVVEAALGAGV